MIHSVQDMSNELSGREAEAIRYIRNCLVHKGRSPSVREIMTELKYKSPHSAMLLIDRLIEAGYLKRREIDKELQLLKEPDETRMNAQTVNVPLVGSVPCGKPLLARENLEAMIPVSLRLARPPHRYFLLRAIGDSMNRAGIQSGNILLVRQQPNAENGEKVVALIDDEATVKELQKSPDAIMLKPKSSNPKHKPIVLTDDFQIQGVVVATLPSI